MLSTTPGKERKGLRITVTEAAKKKRAYLRQLPPMRNWKGRKPGSRQATINLCWLETKKGKIKGLAPFRNRKRGGGTNGDRGGTGKK